MSGPADPAVPAAGNGRVVLVTGGARGLGRGLVAAFAANGDQVVACGRHEPESSDLVDQGVAFVTCDVRDPEQVASLVTTVVDRFGRLDVLVNNAGGGPYAPATTMSPRLFERIVALNLVAPFYVAQRANAVMQTQPGGGVILNIGSTVSVRPSMDVSAYVASKAGLIGLTRSLALEWAPKVRVNMITVGLLRTELVQATYGDDVGAVEATVPMGRLAVPADVGAVCLTLTSPALAYVTGAELIVDGGGEKPAWLLAVVRDETSGASAP
jgi:NAD(P)-dependent dehydrogenase (short-subunit alcohol dehydrogenase family)